MRASLALCVAYLLLSNGSTSPEQAPFGAYASSAAVGQTKARPLRVQIQRLDCCARCLALERKETYLSNHTVVFYATESGKQPVRSYLDRVGRSGEARELARLQRTIDLLVEFGSQLSHLGSTARKLIGMDGLCELRCGRHRIAYYEDSAGKFVLLHAWKKQTMRTPMRHLRLARHRRLDWVSRTTKQ